MDQDASLATRHSLLTRLKNWDDQDGWRQFFDTYWRLIYGLAIKSGLTDDEAQEVVQETVIEISKRIKDFQYDPAIGSFRSWLFQMTRWRITDQLRRRNTRMASAMAAPDGDGTADGQLIDNIPDPKSMEWEQQWNADWQRNIVEAALDRLREKVPGKHFQAFDLYVLKHWPVTRVARITGLNVAQIYLLKHRLRKQLRAEVDRLEKNFI